MVSPSTFLTEHATMQEGKERPDEPVEKDPLDDEDDVVDAITPNKYYYCLIPGDLDD